jgi:hypothetical protein
VGRVIRNLRELGRREPAASRRGTAGGARSARVKSTTA